MATNSSDPRKDLLLSLGNHLRSEKATVGSVVTLLATFGDVTNYADEYFKCILQAAFTNGSFEVFKLLVNRGFQYDVYCILVHMSDKRRYKENGDYADLFPYVIAHVGSEEKNQISHLLRNSLRRIRGGNFLYAVCKYLFPGYALCDRCQGLLFCLRSHLLSKTAHMDSVEGLLSTFGDDINYADEYFKDILRAAFTNGSVGVFKFLEDEGFQYDAYDIFVYMSDADYNRRGHYGALLPHIVAHVRSTEKEMIRLVLYLTSRKPLVEGFLDVIKKQLSPEYTVHDPRQALLLSLRSTLLSKLVNMDSIVHILTEFGEGTNYADNYFKDVLRLAAANGSLEVFKYLDKDIGFRYDAFDILVDMSNGRDYKKDGDYAALIPYIIARAGPEKEARIQCVLPYLLKKTQEGNFLTEVSNYLFYGNMPFYVQ